MTDIRQRRAWLRANWDELKAIQSDQQQKMPYPPLEQPVPADAGLIELPAAESLAGLGQLPLIEAINARVSRRRFSDAALSLDELAFLLWCTQGVKQVAQSGVATLRTVPSGGARHTFETYLAAHRVDGLAPGLYRYLALDHKLLKLREQAGIGAQAAAACLDQQMAGRSAVTFFWASVPYRAEWRYAMAAHKMIAIDAGHVCQNLYLACEAIGCGTCAVGAYDQGLADALIGADGVDELVVYIAPVGKQQE